MREFHCGLFSGRVKDEIVWQLSHNYHAWDNLDRERQAGGEFYRKSS